jgi:threonine dehydratase
MARIVPEPSGAASSAALLFHADELPPWRKAVAIVSGGNVTSEMLAQVLTATSV